MPLLNEPFTFNYFGHTITARSCGPIIVPRISKITSAHVIPITEDGSIVAINVIERGWDIPGGHIDQGELTPQDALRREAHEEANISILEPVLIDVLTLECETLDLSSKPHMLLYAAQVWELNDFKPNDEVSERSLMSAEKFVDCYFGNTVYAKKMLDASMQAIIPDHPSLVAVKNKGANNPSTNQKSSPGKSKHIKTVLIALLIAAVTLLFSFPSLHRLDMTRRMHNMSLPLSNPKASTDTSGLLSDSTYISFTVHKNYSSPLEAKNDIIKQLAAAGIAAPRPAEEPTYVFLQDNGAAGGESPINEIETTYEAVNTKGYTFIFNLEQQISCDFDPDPIRNNYLCEGDKKDDALEKKLINSRPISSVEVYTSIKY